MIEHYEFGMYVIDGREYKYDITIIDGKVGEWDSRDNHAVDKEDVKPLIEAEPEIIIIGKGASGALKVPEEVKELIREKGIELIVEDTGKACEIFNKLQKQGKDAAAIFHGTC